MNANALVGTWLCEDFEPHYVFHTNGMGQRLVYGANQRAFMSDFRWNVSGGILSICSTPWYCGNLHMCSAPEQWNLTLTGNTLTIYSRLAPGMSFTYTRR